MYSSFYISIYNIGFGVYIISACFVLTKYSIYFNKLKFFGSTFTSEITIWNNILSF